jgi:glycosyltransferase involved in cell wall biosynthesis
MKVLHLYSGNLYGGVETLLVTLARLRHLCPEMQPEFGLCFRGRLWDELTATGAPVHDLGQVRLSRPWTVFLARRKLKAVLRATRFDAVICHCCWPLAVFGRVLRNWELPTVYWAHDAGLTPTKPGERRPMIERLAQATKPALSIAISNFTAPHAAGLYPETPIVHYYYPVELRLPENRADTRAKVRLALGVSDGKVVILQVSRLVAYKGQRLLLEALGQLADNPNWVCWQAGGPQQPGEHEYLAELRELATKLGIAERVKFLGERTDVPELLMGADIHCQPNKGPELFGITFIEGLAAGLPVVSTKIGGAAEILDGYGILVAPDDPPALAKALSRLIDDRAERERHGALGPRRAKELCDPQETFPRLKSILRDHLPKNAHES